MIATVLGPCQLVSYRTHSILNGVSLAISGPYQIWLLMYETWNKYHVNVLEFVDARPYTRTTTLRNVTIFEHSTYW